MTINSLTLNIRVISADFQFYSLSAGGAAGGEVGGGKCAGVERTAALSRSRTVLAACYGHYYDYTCRTVSYYCYVHMLRT